MSSKNDKLLRKRSVKRLLFPFIAYRIQSQVMFVYCFSAVINIF